MLKMLLVIGNINMFIHNNIKEHIVIPNKILYFEVYIWMEYEQ